jgi:hypothetical protein
VDLVAADRARAKCKLADKTRVSRGALGRTGKGRRR